MQAYTDGLHDLQIRLGVPTMWERMEPIQKKAWSLASQEFRRRAWPIGNAQAENPRAIVEEIAPRFLGTMGADARMDRDRLLGMAKAQGYTTAAQVHADFAGGKLSKGARDNLLNIFLEIKAKEDLEKQEGGGGSVDTTAERARSFGREKR